MKSVEGEINMKTNINATFETLNGNFLTTGETINEEYLCEAITMWTLNTQWLYKMLKRSKPETIAFAALVDMTNDSLKYEGYQCSNYQIKKWLNTYGNGYDTLKQAVEELKSEAEEIR